MIIIGLQQEDPSETLWGIMAQEEPTTYTVAEAALILGISQDTVRKRIKSETLKAWKRNDGFKEWRIQLDARQLEGTPDSSQKKLQDQLSDSQIQIAALTAEVANLKGEIKATQEHLKDTQEQLAYSRQGRIEKLIKAWRG